MRMILALGFVLSSTYAFAQAVVPFGGFSHDSSQPVEIASDSLAVNQAQGTASFVGNVVVGQGSLRLAADSITVFYGSGDGDAVTGQVSKMEAAGNVTLTNGAEAAESQSASYDVSTGQVAMTGDVLLTQGDNALSGQALAIDLNAGTAQMQGRVQTILQPQATDQ
ncbi:MAG: lipopolysaccharide transport periplasmic protein LptA [Pseudomonadota bacterium]